MVKKLIVGLLFSCLCLIGSIGADSTPEYQEPHKIIEQLTLSVPKVNIWQNNKLIGNGSAFVIKTSVSETILVTARHILEDAFIIGVVFNGQEYQTKEFISSPDTDAGIIIVKPGIPGVVPLNLNLEPTYGLTKTFAVGWWGSARISGYPRTLSLSTGWIDRTCIDKILGPDGKIMRGVLTGSILIYPGYSGGPILDTNLRVLGVNVLLGSSGTTFVDIRWIYNSFSALNGGQFIKFPVDSNYDIANLAEFGYSRLPIDIKTSSLLLKNPTTKTLTVVSLENLIALMKQEINDKPEPLMLMFGAKPTTIGDKVTKWFTDNTQLVIGKETYLLTSIEIEIRGKAHFSKETGHPTSRKYVAIIEDGYEVLLELYQPKESDKAVKSSIRRNLGSRKELR